MQGAENCHRILKSLTGLDFSHTIVEQATQRRVNQRTPDVNSVSEIVAGFTSRQRDWYKLMLSDIVPYFGYGLLDDPEPCAPEMPLGPERDFRVKLLIRKTVRESNLTVQGLVGAQGLEPRTPSV
jgi:hypothetical protein